MAVLALALSLLVSLPLPSLAVTQFLTYPFNQNGVNLQQGWDYMPNVGGGVHHAIDYVYGAIDQSVTWLPFNVVASHDGTAVYHGGCTNNDDSCNGGLGNYVEVTTNIGGVTYKTRYCHLDSSPLPVGQQVPIQRGDFLGVTGITGAANQVNHLHFEFLVNGDKTDPYDVYGLRTAYPENGGSCGSSPFWTSCPPVKAFTTQTAWLFNNGTSEGWTAINIDGQAFQNGQWWVDPGDTPLLYSPYLQRSPSTINYLKIQMRNRGINDHGQVYIRGDGQAFTESKSRNFVNPADSQWRFIVIPLNLIPGWGSVSNLDQIRIDPVDYGETEPAQDNVEIDAIILRLDDSAPLKVSGPTPTPSSSGQNYFTFVWSYTDPDEGDGSGYGSGLDKFEVRFNGGSWQGPIYFSSVNGNEVFGEWTGAVPNIQVGTNTFYVRAYDPVGNVSAASSTNFTYTASDCGPHLASCGTSAVSMQTLAVTQDGAQPQDDEMLSTCITTGQPVENLFAIPGRYRIGFEYRSASSKTMRLQLEGEASGQFNELDTVHLVSSPGEWHPFWSRTFTISDDQISNAAKLRFAFADGVESGVEIRNLLIWDAGH